MAAENEYTIQIGIDASPFNKGLQAMKDDIKEIQSLVKTSNGVLRDNFVLIGKSIQDISQGAVKNLKQVGIQSKAMLDAAKPLTTVLSKMDTKGVESLDKALKAMGNRFDDLQQKAAKSKGIVNEDDAKKAAGISDEVDKIIEALTNLQKTGTSTFDEIGKSIDAFVEKVKNAVKEVHGLETETAKLEIPTVTGTQAKTDDTKASDKKEETGSFEKTVDAVKAVSGAFTTAKEAAELFGEEGEAVAKDLDFLIKGLGNVQKLLEVGALLDKNSTANQKLRLLLTGQETVATTEKATATLVAGTAEKVLAEGEKEAEVAQWGLNAAMDANPIGVILLAVGALIAAYEIFKNTIGKVSDEELRKQSIAKAATEAQEKSVDEVADETGHLNLLLAALDDETATRAQKQTALDEIRAKYPEYLSGLTLENHLTEQSQGLIKEETALIAKRAEAKAAEELYIEQLKESIKTRIEEKKATQEADEAQAGFNESLSTGDAGAMIFSLGNLILKNHEASNATEKTGEQTTIANAYLEEAVKLNKDLTATMNGSSSQADDFANNIGHAAGSLGQFIGNIQGLNSAMPFLNAFLNFKPIPFDPAQFDKERKEMEHNAQVRVDVAEKGTAEEYTARRSMLKQLYDEDLKDQRLNKDQRIELEQKYNAEVRDLNKQSMALYYGDRIAAQQAISTAIAAFGDKDSDDYVNSRKKALTDASKLAIAQANYDKDQRAKIEAQLAVDIANVDIERQKAINDKAKALITVRLLNAKKGSQDELEAQTDLLINQRDQELNILGLTNQAKLLINTQYEVKKKQLTDKFNQQQTTDDLTTQITGINARLEAVKKGSADELKLKQDLIDKQQQLDVENAKNTIASETLKQAKIDVINAKAIADKKALNKDYINIQLATLAAEEQLAEKAIETFKDGSLTETQLTKVKEEKKLAIKKEYAQKELDIYLKSLGDQNVLTQDEIKKLQDPANIKAASDAGVDIFTFLNIKVDDAEVKKTFDNLSEGLNKGAKKDGFQKLDLKKSFFKALGFSPDNKEQGEIIDGIVNSVSQAYESITKDMEEKAQRQIDAIQKVIDATQEQIDQQQDIVDKEKELSDKGLANDLTNQQKKLDDLKAKKDEEIKAREAATKKLQEIRKTEAAIQAAGILASNIEASANMVGAAAKIFGSFAKIPFGVGIAIAIAVIGSMYAAFSSIKKSFRAAAESDTPKMRRGGGFMLNGPSHEDGGIGLYSGGRKLAEYEGDEYLFAINRNSTRKYLPLLEAINSDRLPAMQAILNNGRLPMDDVQQILVTHREVEDINIAAGVHLHNRQWDSLKHLQHLPRIEEVLSTPKKEFIDMGGYILEREGNRTRKVKKV